MAESIFYWDISWLVVQYSFWWFSAEGEFVNVMATLNMWNVLHIWEVLFVARGMRKQQWRILLCLQAYWPSSTQVLNGSGPQNMWNVFFGKKNKALGLTELADHSWRTVCALDIQTESNHFFGRRKGCHPPSHTDPPLWSYRGCACAEPTPEMRIHFVRPLEGYPNTNRQDAQKWHHQAVLVCMGGPVGTTWKKSVSLCRCNDRKKLNSINKLGSIRPPMMDDLFSALGGTHFLGTLGPASTRWWVKLTKKNRKKSAFAVPNGLSEFRVITVGLKNVPFAFQISVNHVLEGLINEQPIMSTDESLIWRGQIQDIQLN